MKVKVCGMTRIDQLVALEGLGVHYAGLIFYPQSKRFAAHQLSGQEERIGSMRLESVGVFVNESEQKIRDLIRAYKLSAVQLHGDEDPAFCSALMSDVTVIKAFRVTGDEDIDALVAPFQGACDHFLFDTQVPGTKTYGGTGSKFNWEVLQRAHIGKSFFLSGGIGPDDANDVAAFIHPYFYAVDLNSRFEVEPGVKDMERVRKFVGALNK